MSEPELAYMTGTNDDFDLPRWQPQHPPPLATTYDALSSSAQAAQAAQASANSSYLYHAPPPPPPPAGGPSLAQRLPPLSHSASTSSTTSRPPRIAQLVEQETDQQQHHHLSPIGGLGAGNAAFGPPSPYSSSLARSTSLGGATTSRRRHHPANDLEGAFGVDSTDHTATSARGPVPQNSFYSPSVGAYPTEPPGDGHAYQDMYYSGSGAGTQLPKRAQTQHHTSASSRSPHRSSSSKPALLDPYSPHSQSQSPYSPTAGGYPYPPASSSVSHARSHSGTVKVEDYQGQPGGTIPSPYSPPSTASVYGGTYPMDTSTPSNAPPQTHGAHLSPQPYIRPSSLSTPASPLGYPHSQSPHYYPQDDQTMMVDSAPKAVQRTSGFRRVRDQRDLRPNVNPQPVGRRMDSDGNWLSPLRQLTTNLVDTFHICNPQFRYESAHNPRRVLTKPSKPSHNDGYDNEDYDYILYVNDWLGAEEGHNRYLILDVLGQGTFGQVVKCQNMKTHEIVAVKVVKNKPAYFNQSMMEVTILELLNNQCDPNDEHHILRLRDSFIHKNHLCLVFELLSSNLYELIKQNQFQGLSTQLVKVFAAQLLDSLTVLKEARLIHCDLKPENILLKSLSSPQIKVIDFGSACHERQTVYTYIQSRFYRSPEVLLGNPYTAAIDMWSLGCIVVELFLGLPLFPGTSEYNQITRIVDMLGMPPAHMLEFGKQTNQFFDSYIDMYGQKKYRLKSIEQYSREHNTQEQPGKQYFKHTTLPDIVNNAPVHNYKSSSRGANHEHEKEMANRASFIDFCHGLLNLDPVNRWTPQQARQHPFITGEKWTGPWQPSATAPSHSATPPAKNPTPDPKRPYGGLVPSQPKGQRAYQDAASYNQQLAQHQAYTAQAATQAANSAYARNPYMQPSTSQPSSAYASPPESANPPFPQPQTQFSSQNNGHGGSAHQTSHGHLAINTSVSQYPSHGSSGGSGANVSGHLEPGPPAATYYPTTRARANTVNQIDVVPPALARLRHMTQDVIGGRNALTPVLNREDALKEWERRQSGKAAAAQPYPQLEHLHQQAELAGSGGLYNWGHASTSARYHPPGTSKLAQSYHPAGALVDDDRRDAIMSNVRSAARGDSGSFGGSASNQNYSGSGSSRYAPASYSQAQSPTSPFDSLERRTDIGTLYVPMQPDQYQPYPSGGTGSQQQRQPAQNIAPSFYSGGVVAAGQPSNGVGTQRNPFGAVDGGQGSVKDSRRHSGMDVWPR